MSNEASPLLELANSGADLDQVFSNMKENTKAPLDFTEMPLPAEPREEPSSTITAPVPNEETTIIERNYVNGDGSGPRPENETVPLKRAAKDLGEQRREEFELAEKLREQRLAEEVERLRSPLAKEVAEAEAATPEPQQTQEPQAQQQPGAQPADHDLSRVLQENPRLMEAIQQQRQADWAGANQTIQAAEQWIQASAAQATAGVFVTFPELQNVSLQELPIALNMMQRQNPQRHAQVMHHINSIQGMLEQSRFVQQQQQQRAAQQYQHEWSQWSADEDAKFNAAHPETNDPVKQSQIAQRAQAYLENIGLSKDDIGRAWQGHASISLRDSRAQRILYDAMRYREAVAGVPAARANTPLRVQRPGSSTERVSAGDADDRSIINRLDKMRGSDAAKLGAQLIAQRRARSR